MQGESWPPAHEMSNRMLGDILVALRLSAEFKRKQTYTFYRHMTGELETYGMRCCLELQKLTWIDYAEPIFHDLVKEAKARELDWDVGLVSEEPIDLNNRGKLERLVVGAVKDCINAHGPVTMNNASSVGKRVIGVIKHFNKSTRNDNARKDGLLAPPGTPGYHQADEGESHVSHRLLRPDAEAG